MYQHLKSICLPVHQLSTFVNSTLGLRNQKERVLPFNALRSRKNAHPKKISEELDISHI